MATLTIRNLDEGVKRRLRVTAARHGRSMEAEARDILAKGVDYSENPVAGQPIKRSFEHLVGIWKDKGTTDELMRELREEA